MSMNHSRRNPGAARTVGRALLLSALLAGALGAGCDRSPAAHVVDGVEAHRLVAGGASLIDVRTPGDFVGGHVEGARLGRHDPRNFGDAPHPAADRPPTEPRP